MHPGHALFGGEVHDALAIVQEKTIGHHEERSFAVRGPVTPGFEAPASFLVKLPLRAISH